MSQDQYKLSEKALLDTLKHQKAVAEKEAFQTLFPLIFLIVLFLGIEIFGSLQMRFQKEDKVPQVSVSSTYGMDG